MSVVGIDFGNESCFIAVAKGGGIETIANDYSLRATPACVAFQERSRICGVAAANQRVTNMKNTIVGFKRLLGRKFNDPVVQQEAKYLPYTIVPNSDGSVGIQVRYMNEDQVFTPEQITAMLFSHLKGIAEIALKTVVNDCVISVPWYFTHAERKAVMDAARIAGLNVLRLFNETTSTALSYGIYKQDLPAPEEKPRNVVFVDCGYSSLQVSITAFNNGKLKTLAAAADPNLGGRDFDRILAEHMAKDFLAKYKVDAMKNPRAYLRLTTEIEKLKKQMSANSTKLPLNIECFMEDKDVTSSMQRSDLETLCQDLLARVKVTLTQCLADSQLSPDDIYSVEVVGGSTRIPAIKNLIEEVFRKPASTTLNQDEAVARGCALQCAALSPAIRVRDFAVADVQNYPVVLKALAVPNNPKEKETDIEMFPRNHQVPFTRQTTLVRSGNFDVELHYNGPTPYPDPYIARYTIQGLKPNTDRVRVKVRVNLHGLVVVTGAVGLEPITAAEQEKLEKEEKMDTEPPQENGTAGENQPEKETNEEQMDAQAEEKKEKRKTRLTDLTFTHVSHGLSETEISNFFEAEGKMAANDRREKERVDAKNSLEEYVYDLRSKLQDEGQLSRFVEPNLLGKLDTKLEDVVNWLYEEGEDMLRQVYVDKLDELKKIGDPIKNRKVEADVRPAVIENLAGSIQQSYKILDQYRNQDEKYAHIPSEDMMRAQEETEKVSRWLDEQRIALDRIKIFENPPITVSEIRQQKQTFENTVAPIYNKPKPKVEPPPVSPSNTTDQEATGDGQTNSPKPNAEEKMDTEA